MKKLSILTCTMLVLTGFVATTVRADSPHFLRASAALNSAMAYCVTFKEAGLGSTAITYQLTATTADFTYQCFTKSNNEPQGAPNHIHISNDSTFVTIFPHNGQINGTVCLGPTAPPSDASCQGHGLELRLIAVDYDGVTFCDTTTPLCLDASFTPDLGNE